MEYSRKIADRLWNLPDKGEAENKREETFIDDIVQKSHIEKEILAHIADVETVFDGGAGSGRFSILLAKLGKRVVHFDCSQPMLDKAQELAERAGVSANITFVKGALEDLSAYADASFDMVMSFDAPISYTHPHQERVIAELVRIAKKRIMISVSSRLGSVPYVANPLQKNQFILDEHCGDGWVQWCLDNRDSMIDTFAFNQADAMRALQTGFLGDVNDAVTAYNNGETPWCITYHFMPDELQGILQRLGVKNIQLAGPGAFARTIPNEILRKIMNDKQQKADFLDFCHTYDSIIYVCGLGKDNLFARGEIG